MKKQQIIMALVLFTVLVLSRIIPHPHNFTALIGVALFSGALWGDKTPWANGRGFRFVVPLVASLATDMYLGFYPGMEWTYLGIAASVLFAPQLDASVLKVSARAFVAAIVFFSLSNVGVWWSSGLYTQDISGLGQCFTMAIPFFQNTVASSLIFSIGFFSLYRFAFLEKGFQGFVTADYGR